MRYFSNERFNERLGPKLAYGNLRSSSMEGERYWPSISVGLPTNPKLSVESSGHVGLISQSVLGFMALAEKLIGKFSRSSHTALLPYRVKHHSDYSGSKVGRTSLVSPCECWHAKTKPRNRKDWSRSARLRYCMCSGKYWRRYPVHGA